SRKAPMRRLDSNNQSLTSQCSIDPPEDCVQRKPEENITQAVLFLSPTLNASFVWMMFYSCGGCPQWFVLQRKFGRGVTSSRTRQRVKYSPGSEIIGGFTQRCPGVFAMITSAAKLAIMSGALCVITTCIITTGALAQSIRPECTKMRDPIGCTCA